MIPSDYETVDVKRATVKLLDGVRTPGEPVHVGSLGMLVAPGSYEREDEVGRRTVTFGAEPGTAVGWFAACWACSAACRSCRARWRGIS